MRLLHLLWALVERFGTNAVSFVGNITLCYLLSPDDFGLLAMLGVFTALVFTLVDCGMGDALLMYKAPSRRDFNTVFFFNVAVGVALAALYVALAPLVARFFGHAELAPVMRVLAGGAILTALTITPITRLRSLLRFGHVAIVNVVAIVVAVTAAIVAALSGARYWALVVLQVAFPGAQLLLLVFLSRWELRWEFDVARFKQLWRFSANLLASYLVSQVSQNIFSLILGKFYNASQAGYFGQAQKLQSTPTSSLEGAISVTAYVSIAKCTEPDRRRALVLRVFGMMTWLGDVYKRQLIALSKPLIACLLPHSWQPVTPFLVMLVAWGLVAPVCNHLSIIFKLYDHTSTIRNVLLIEKTAIVLAAFALYPWGVPAMIGAAAAISVVSYLLYTHAASRIMEVNAKRFHALYTTHLAMGTIVGALTWLATLPWASPWVSLAVGLIVFVCLSLVVCRLLRPDYYSTLARRLSHLVHSHDETPRE